MATHLSQYRSVAPARLDQRAARRHPVVIAKATVRRHGNLSANAELRDLSVYGCRLDTDVAMPVGERVWLRLAGSPPLGATVIWTDAGLIGCRFDELIDKRLFRALTLGDF